MSDGSGGWAGKEVKGGQASQIRETCVMYVLCMRHVCGKGKPHWGRMERTVPPATPPTRWEQRVREGGRGAAQRRGTMVTSVLAAAEGLRGELAEGLRGRDVGWRSGGTLPRPGGLRLRAGVGAGRQGSEGCGVQGA